MTGKSKAHNQRGWGSVFNNLSSHESVAKKHPEKSRNSTCMDGRKDDKGCGSLFEKRASRDELEGEGEKVCGEKCTKFDTT